MLRGKLRYKPGALNERTVPVGSYLVVGRTADCGLIVDDPAASRHHLEIVRDGDAFTWRDLESTNGTLVNGTPEEGGPLTDGDRLQIGKTELLFELEEAPTPSDSSMVRETILDSQARALLPPDQGKAADLLRAVYTVTNEIASNYEPCHLVDKILETTIRAVDAQRGAIFFGDAESAELLPCPVCGHIHMIRENVLTHADGGEIKISRTVAHHVLGGGESVLYQDTGTDTDVMSSESIHALQLRSIICVPLRGKFGILGVLYMDTDRPEQHYSREDLLLSTAVGNSAGLALENATMHQQILEKQRIDQEIEHAWRIQQGFLTREWPATDDLIEIYGETRPAKIVGGDCYDSLSVDPGGAGIFIGDVSGKGVPAALAMAQLLTEFRLSARETTTPKDVVRALNAGMTKRSEQGMFVTVLWLLLDPKTGRARWSNAGHHPPVRIGRNGAVLLAEASGPPIGVLPGDLWEDQETTIDPGDTILLYTDGVVEAQPAAAPTALQEYGAERLCRVAATFYGRSPKELIDGINEDVRRFCEPSAPHDDVTMIAVRYRP